MYQALPSRLHVKDSPIAGQGIFALEDIPAGFFLGMSHIIVDEVIYRTPLGGFINHSDEPNCVKWSCLLYTSPSPRDQRGARMPASA